MNGLLKPLPYRSYYNKISAARGYEKNYTHLRHKTAQRPKQSDNKYKTDSDGIVVFIRRWMWFG
jgi:hypothetical protein